MYAIYTYNAGATQADVLNDLIKLLCYNDIGVGNLSASCNTALTQIFRTVKSGAQLWNGGSVITDTSVSGNNIGWSVYDAAAGTNAQVVRAPWHSSNDVGSNFKYAAFDTNTANVFGLGCYESWNSGTHTGTNACHLAYSTANNQRLALAAGGIIYIQASPRHIVLQSYNTTNGYGIGGPYYGPTGIFERTRLSPWDTNANTYPPFFWVGTGTAVAAQYALAADYTHATAPRIVGKSGTDITGATNYMTINTPLGTIYDTATFASASLVISPIPDANKIPQHVLIPWSLCSPSQGFFGGDCSSFSDMWITTFNYGYFGDELSANGKTYVVWTSGTQFGVAGAGWRYAVLKG